MPHASPLIPAYYLPPKTYHLKSPRNLFAFSSSTKKASEQRNFSKGDFE
jgi:hypothetical protein